MPTTRSSSPRPARATARAEPKWCSNARLRRAPIPAMSSSGERPSALVRFARCVPIANRGDYTNPNVVKVVLDRNGDALYFSRAPIPHFRDQGSGIRVQADPRSPIPDPCYKHIGLYGYRRMFLLKFSVLPQTALERSESLEQLRAMEHGYRIRTIVTTHDSIGVDTPEDLERVRLHVATT